MSGWYYGAVRTEDGEVALCEVFPEFGHTGPVTLVGEDTEELKHILRMALSDLEAFGEVLGE